MKLIRRAVLAISALILATALHGPGRAQSADVPAAPDPTKAALIGDGLPGWWAVDCAKPLSQTNPYLLYTIPKNGPATAVGIIYLPEKQVVRRVLSRITRAAVNARQLEMTSDLIADAVLKTGGVRRSIFVHQDGGIRQWASHVSGVLAQPFGSLKAGDRIDRDVTVNGVMVNPDGKRLTATPVFHRCGDALPALPALLATSTEAPLLGTWSLAFGSLAIDARFNPDGTGAIMMQDAGQISVTQMNWFVTLSAPMTNGRATSQKIVLYDEAGYPPSSVTFDDDVTAYGTGQQLTLVFGRHTPGVFLPASRPAWELGLEPPPPDGAAPVPPPMTSGDPTKAALLEFGLSGQWAVDCTKPPSIANPYVTVTVPEIGPATSSTELAPGKILHAEYTQARLARPGLLQVSVRTVNDPIFANGTSGEAVLVRQGGGTRVWSLHVSGTLVKGGGTYNRDTVFMGRTILSDDKVGPATPVRHRCGESVPSR